MIKPSKPTNIFLDNFDLSQTVLSFPKLYYQDFEQKSVIKPTFYICILGFVLGGGLWLLKVEEKYSYC